MELPYSCPDRKCSRGLRVLKERPGSSMSGLSFLGQFTANGFSGMFENLKYKIQRMSHTTPVTKNISFLGGTILWQEIATMIWMTAETTTRTTIRITARTAIRTTAKTITRTTAAVTTIRTAAATAARTTIRDKEISVQNLC